jgi:hypothetical protein
MGIAKLAAEGLTTKKWISPIEERPTTPFLQTQTSSVLANAIPDSHK